MISYQQFLYIGPNAIYEDTPETRKIYNEIIEHEIKNFFKERDQEQ